MSWSFKINFSDTVVNAPPPKEGIYKVKIVSTEEYESQNGNARLRINGEVSEGPAKGCTINDGFNFPKSPDDGVIRFWMQFLVSLGHTSAELRKKFTGKTKLIPSDIEGREGYCHFAPASEEGGYPSRRWITRGQALSSLGQQLASGNESDASVASTSDDDPLANFLNI
jgi:hypothetical protein